MRRPSPAPDEVTEPGPPDCRMRCGRSRAGVLAPVDERPGRGGKAAPYPAARRGRRSRRPESRLVCPPKPASVTAAIRSPAVSSRSRQGAFAQPRRFPTSRRRLSAASRENSRRPSDRRSASRAGHAFIVPIRLAPQRLFSYKRGASGRTVEEPRQCLVGWPITPIRAARRRAHAGREVRTPHRAGVHPGHPWIVTGSGRHGVGGHRADRSARSSGGPVNGMVCAQLDVWNSWRRRHSGTLSWCVRAGAQ